MIGCSPSFAAFGKSMTNQQTDLGITFTPQEKAYTHEEREEKRKKMQMQVNPNSTKPEFADGDHILYRKGKNDKEVYGPEIVQQVIRKRMCRKHWSSIQTKHLSLFANAVRYYLRPALNPLTLAVYAILVSSCCLATSFNNERPVLWEHTNIPVLDGFIHFDHLLEMNDTFKTEWITSGNSALKRVDVQRRKTHTRTKNMHYSSR